MRNYKCGKCKATFNSRAEKNKHYSICKKGGD